MKHLQKDKLMEDIENLRRKLNSNVDLENNTPLRNEQTYTISCQLDELICKYMKATHWK